MPLDNLALLLNRQGHFAVSLAGNTHADVAELADAQDSGSCGRKVVEVRFLSSALVAGGKLACFHCRKLAGNWKRGPESGRVRELRNRHSGCGTGV